MEIQSVGKNSIFEFIKSRKDITNFAYRKISDQTLRNIIECGSWAPLPEEGYEPWKVNIVVHPTVKQMIAETMDFDTGSIISDANADLVIFRKINENADRDGDLLSIGAFIQNMLLFAHSVDELGTALITNLKDQTEEILRIFKLTSSIYEPIAIIALGAVDEEIKQQKEAGNARISIDNYVDMF
ncbi:MAG: hypothetical protein GF311_03880 [Candidatus Lokiarchaeota archaeon]|nr:hypothetical protein [Candidatus Lokiarchaeota archaeon]